MRKHALIFVFVFTCLLVLLAIPAYADTTFNFTIDGTYNYAEAQDVLDGLNQLRIANGLSPVTLDVTLTEMAMQRAAECAVYYSHTRPSNTPYYSILSPDSYFLYCSSAENIAWGYGTASTVMSGWTNSPGHYTNMTNSSYTSVGIGCFYQEDGSRYWCQLFSSKPARSVCTTDTQVKKADIPISMSVDFANFGCEDIGDCNIMLYEGTSIEPIFFVRNLSVAYNERTYVSGGYTLQTSNTSRYTVSGETITGKSEGLAGLYVIFDTKEYYFPVQVLDKPALSCKVTDNRQLEIKFNGYLDNSTRSVGVYFKEKHDELWTKTNITTDGGTYILYDVCPGESYTCVVRYYDDNYERWVEVSDRTTIKVVLATPKPSITTVASSGKPKLTWDSVQGASSYEIYRATSTDGTYSKIGSTQETSYTDKKATEENKYYYKVKAICGNNTSCNSKFSTVKSITCDLARPTVTASNVSSSGKIKLTWDKISGADKYTVYRATSSDGTFKEVYTTTGTSYTNTSATAENKYYYKVKAISTKTENANSAYSTVVSRTCDLAQPSLSASNVASSGKIKLTWEKVSGADKYKVYRAGTKNGEYKYLGYTTGTTYTNSTANAEYTYYYKVKAISTKTEEANSVCSNIVSRTCDLAQPKVSVSNVASSGKIKLTWEKVSGADKYKVYRATSKSGEYKYLGYTSGTSYTNSTAKAGSRYYYKVKAISDRNENANSAYSSVVSRLCDLARPDVTIKLNSSGKPKLTWDKVEGATKYEIWRKVGSNGEYEKYDTTTKTSYTNSSAKSGKTYYYKVKAVYGSNTSANSALSTAVYKTAK